MTGSSSSEGEGTRAPSKGPSKFGIASTAWSTYGNLKKLMEGDPQGAVGLFGDAGKWAQALAPAATATPVIKGGLWTLTAVSVTMGEEAGRWRRLQRRRQTVPVQREEPRRRLPHRDVVRFSF